MFEYKKVSYYLNNCQNEWSYSFSLDERLKPLKAKSFIEAKKEVNKIIEMAIMQMDKECINLFT